MSTVYRFIHHLRRAYDRVAQPLTVGVRGLVRNGEAVLLVRHSYMDGWYFPGGGVERGESVEEALRRELAEEVGVSFTAAPLLLGVFSNFREYKSDHVLFFEAKEWSMVPAPNLEIVEQRFFSLADPPPDTSPGTLRRIAELTGQAPPSFLW